MSKQTIKRIVKLQPDWKENDNQGFKDYLEEVFKVNQSISSLFEDEKVSVISMQIEMSVEVEDFSIDNEIPLVPIDISTEEIIDILSEEQSEIPLT
jgi:hypothetical protein